MLEGTFSAAIFDFDGTLVDSMPYWNSLLQDYLEEKGLSPDREAKAILDKMSLSQGIFFLKNRFCLEESPEQIKKELEEQILSIYTEKCRLKPGVAEVLQDLKKRKIPMVIATITSKHCAKKALKRLGLKPYFSCLMTDEDVGKSKNHPELYLAVAKKLKTKPGDCVVFEDNYRHGMVAKRAGFVVYAVEDSCNGETFSQFLAEADGRAPW